MERVQRSVARGVAGEQVAELVRRAEARAHRTQVRHQVLAEDYSDQPSGDFAACVYGCQHFRWR